VVRYLREHLSPRLRRPLRFDVLTGASIGSINACFLAATATTPQAQGRRLTEAWESLDINATMKLDLSWVARLATGRGRPSGMCDGRVLERIVHLRIPWHGIRESIRRGALDALAVSAMHLRSGATVTFVERREGVPPTWGSDAPSPLREVCIGPDHALASSAIPILFPPILIDGAPYCDGGLRRLTPLGPALRLGADAVVVVALGRSPPVDECPRGLVGFAGYLLGMFLCDQTEVDLRRLRHVNRVLAARDVNPAVIDAVSGINGRTYRRVDDLLIRPSADPGMMALSYIRTARFRRRARGLFGRLLCELAERDADTCGLLSFLLFDGGYASELVALGAEDARRQEEALARLVERPRDLDLPRSDAA
jgi:NTE family protein